MFSLMNVRIILLTSCILSSCFMTDLTVEVTSENVHNHFIINPRKDKMYELQSSSTNIEKISANAFNSVKNCETIQITNCIRLSALPVNLFHNKLAFQNVEYVKFERTGILHLSEHIFREMILLKYLSLNDNQFQSLPPNLFLSITNLQTVSISANRKLLSLPVGLLKNNEKLTKISIKGNILLESLPPQLFPNFVYDNIELEFEMNHLKYIYHETFSNVDFTKIKFLDISDNYLVCLPDYFLDEAIVSYKKRQVIYSNENCFDKSLQICSLYNCNENKYPYLCKEAENLTNTKVCEKGYVYSRRNDSKISEDTKDDVKNDGMNTGWIVFYVMIPCVITIVILLVGVSVVYFGLKKGDWTSFLGIIFFNSKKPS